MKPVTNQRAKGRWHCPADVYQLSSKNIMNTGSRQKSSCRDCSAFTLIELLVVIAIIGILAAFLLPVLGKVKDRGYQANCINNLKQLGLGFQLYHNDFHDEFPAPGSKDQYGPQPEDWIWWQFGREVQNSTIGGFIGNFNPKLFTCPADKRAISLQTQGYIGGEPYRYSYSLTSYSLANNNINPGMATIITRDRHVFPFKVTSIKNPSIKIMLVEEDDKTIDDPRWVPFGRTPNLISSRHRGKGDITFADGRVEPETPKFGLDRTNSQPTL